MVETDYTELSEYYVYAYLRKSDNTPYYIGKGCGSRMFSKQHSVTVPNDKSQIQLIASNLTESMAHSVEIMLIGQYGRKDLGTGILHNRTDGGEGSSGVVVSPETRLKISMALKGRKLPPRNKDHCDNISKSLKGKTIGPHYVTCPHCGTSGGGGNMTRYHFEKCKSKND